MVSSLRLEYMLIAVWAVFGNDSDGRSKQKRKSRRDTGQD